MSGKTTLLRRIDERLRVLPINQWNLPAPVPEVQQF
jgi:hypothetical protein